MLTKSLIPRFLFYILIIFAFTDAEAGSLCRGYTRVSSPMVLGGVTTRLLTLQFSPDLDLCEHLLKYGPKEAKITWDIEGDAAEYDGPIFLDGTKAHVVKEENGDVSHFWLRLLPDDKIEFSSKIYARDPSTPLLEVQKAILKCF